MYNFMGSINNQLQSIKNYVLQTIITWWLIIIICSHTLMLIHIHIHVNKRTDIAMSGHVFSSRTFEINQMQA